MKVVIDIRKLILEAYRMEASDVHLSVGTPPIFRIYGKLRKHSEIPPLSNEELTQSIQLLLKDLGLNLKDKKELDFSFGIEDLIRVRANVYYERKNIAAALRIITKNIRSFDELGLPSILKDFCDRDRGLVLVAGPTGSGKSTTLAAMIDYINSRRPVHIITIEDPIEYLFENKMALVHQRELGMDTESFADGLKYSLRQDPDVILVGEMRDPETMELALTAAETGHLVFATIHTNSAATAPERIIGVFPPVQQKQIALQIANTLIGIIYQRLLTKRNGRGFIPIVEILIGTPAIKNLIRENKLHQVESMMEAGGRFGMVTFDDALVRAFNQGMITKEDALLFARDQENVKKRLI
ncbi:MAG: type IV pilus twitching motility protein PilT [Thermotogae bacterium]|nr:type IV pilus twitching motility protein PilT [Thermotogota bacterium]